MKRLTILFILLSPATILTAQSNSVNFTFNHVALSVKDLEKSATFYQDILNLNEINNRTKNAERRWFSLGEDKELHLIHNEEAVKINMGIHMALTTPDFDEFVEVVKAGKVAYYDWRGNSDEISIREDGIKQIYIQDPDGYWIEVNSVAEN